MNLDRLARWNICGFRRLVRKLQRDLRTTADVSIRFDSMERHLVRLTDRG